MHDEGKHAVDDVKFQIQDAEYEFPYHYLVTMNHGKGFRLHHKLAWGLEYATYISFVAEIIQQYQPRSLLDVGCGDGRLLSIVKSLVPQLGGVDLSARAVAFARAFNPAVDFICGDIATVSRKYACITLIEVLEHIPDSDVDGFVRSCAQRLDEGGFLLVTVPTANVTVSKKHYRHYTIDSLRASLEMHFQIEACWWLYRRCVTERLIRLLLCNRIFTLNLEWAVRLLWVLHRRLTYMADSLTGSHLVCIARAQQ